MHFSYTLAALFVSLSITTSLSAAERVALVIGNSAYVHGNPLTNPKADAEDVAAALKACGFDLVGDGAQTDLTHEQMEARVTEFGKAAEESKVALFFFAGHGLEVDGGNYLVPVDAKVEDKYQVKHRTLPLDEALGAMAGEGKLKIVILDSCRNNPLGRGWGRDSSAGLGAPKSTPGGTILLFAAAPGQVAADGRGRNSPFSTVLKSALLTPGMEIERVFKNVGAAVKRSTGKQEPWMNSSFYGTFSFVPGAGGSVPEPMPTIPVDPFAGVTQNAPFENGLGMKFVPAGTPGILFSVWETRVGDFRAFVEDTGYDAIGEKNGDLAYTLEEGGKWEQAGGSWKDPRFPKSASQNDEYPVACVSYLDAEAFCAWLTKRDRASGKIPSTASYRLPTDVEWSRANGSGKYPWGDSYPPGRNDGNYSGKEAMIGVYEGFSDDLVKAGRSDSAPRTSAVGMFQSNGYGLRDMGGNVYEWCSTWYKASMNEADALEKYEVLKNDGGGEKYRVLRGGSWYADTEFSLRSSYRDCDSPRYRGGFYGFRCVLVVSGG